MFKISPLFKKSVNFSGKRRQEFLGLRMLNFQSIGLIWTHTQGDFYTSISVPLKVFDTINHELLVAKLYAHGFPIEALEFYQVRYKVGRKETRSTQRSFLGTQLLQRVLQRLVL